jgi:acetyl-CoA carboxylase carboxyltransferase component
MGIASWIPAMSDFVYALPDVDFFMMSPNTYEKSFPAAAGEEKGAGRGPSAGREPRKPDCVIQCHPASEAELIADLGVLMSLIPSNRLDKFKTETDDSPNREDANLGDPADLTAIIASIADNGVFAELGKTPAAGQEQAARTCLCKCFGHTLGVIAVSGALSSAALRKINRLASFCASFGVAVLTLVNTEGFVAGDEDVIREGGRLMRTLISAQSPKLCVITGRAVGGAYMLLLSRHVGADLVYAWSGARVSLLNGEAERRVTAVVTELTPEEAGAFGYVDGVIYPGATRKRVAAALEMLFTKSFQSTSASSKFDYSVE